MNWDLERPDVLHVLKCMGIELPTDTKLPDDALDRRLRDALHAAQYKDSLVSPLDLCSLPPWPVIRTQEADTSARSIFKAVQRGSMRRERWGKLYSLEICAERTIHIDLKTCLKVHLTR